MDMPFMHYDQVARNQLKMEERVVHWKSNSLADPIGATFGPGLVSSDVSIILRGERFSFNKTLFRVGNMGNIIKIVPHGFPTNSPIKRITIIPRLYCYVEDGNRFLSQTCVLKGRVDFKNSGIDLEIYNSVVIIQFDQRAIHNPFKRNR